MKKMLIAAIAASVAVVAFCEESKPAPKMSKDEMRHKYMMATGGQIVKPGTPKGFIAIVDAQSEVAHTNLDIAAGTFTYQTQFDIRVVKASPAEPQEILKSLGANVIVVVVSDAVKPPLLVAPEERWALVNVAKLKGGLPDGKLGTAMLATRCRKEVIRAFSIVCGGFASNYRGNVLSAVTVDALDSSREEVPFDVVQLFKPYLKDLGVEERFTTSYRNAVAQGWAPQPTNEYQKAVWDRLHTLPTNPIRIKPESQRKK